MDFSKNYFQLFGLPQDFLVDTDKLSNNYRQLQRQLHPDKFASKSASEQRLAVQFSSYMNTAYQVLKSPLLCAEYLLELADYPVDKERLTIKDGEFLLKQMEWRESLADLAETVKQPVFDALALSEQLDNLTMEVSSESQLLLKRFHDAYQQSDFETATQQVAQLHFVEKMRANIEQLEEDLFD